MHMHLIALHWSSGHQPPINHYSTNGLYSLHLHRILWGTPMHCVIDAVHWKPHRHAIVLLTMNVVVIHAKYKHRREVFPLHVKISFLVTTGRLCMPLKLKHTTTQGQASTRQQGFKMRGRGRGVHNRYWALRPNT